MRVSLFLTILIFCFFASIYDARSQSVTTPYVYPVKPGTEEWKALKTQKEKLRVCQVPEDILRNMTPDALVETCLSYPMFDVAIIAHDGRQEGFDALVQDFNGIRELLRRKDVGSSLLSRYRDFDPLAYDTSWTPVKRGYFKLSLNRLEILLSQDTILSNMDAPTRKEILSLTVEKFKAKQQHPDFYKGNALINSAFLAGRIMAHDGHEKFVGTNSDTIDLNDFLFKDKPWDEMTLYGTMLEAEKITTRENGNY
jgi:hypothetical protein